MWERGLAVAIALAGCGRVGFVDEPHVFAYVIDGYSPTNTQPSLRIFEVGTGGALVEAASSPFELGARPSSVTGNADGTTLYVTTYDASLFTLAIAPTTGALTILDQDIMSGQPAMVAIHPGGWLYVPTWGQEIHGFAVDADGLPSPIEGSPWTVTGAAFDWVEVHPGGAWAYAVDEGFAVVHELAVAPQTGALAALGPAPWDTNDSSPHALLLDATGGFGFVSPDLAGGIPGCTVDRVTGAMTTTPGSPFGSSANTSLYAAMNRDRRRLFVANDGNSTLSAYRIDSVAGGLVHLAGSPFDIQAVIWGVAASPASDDVYVTTTHTQPAIVHFRADDATLTWIEPYDFPGLASASVLTLVQTNQP